MAPKTLNIVYAADTGAVTKALGDVESNHSSTFGKVAKMGVAAAAAIGAAAIGAGAALFKVGESFDDASDTIRVQTGATGKVLEDLEGSFRNVVKDVPTDFASASSAIATINQKLDLSGPLLENRSKQFLELSRITKTDLAANVESGTAVLQSFNVEGSKQGPILDQIFRASQQSGVGFQELTSQLAEGGIQFRAIGLDITESTALVAALGKAGVSTSDVLPALGKAMAVAAKEGKSAKDLFTETFDRIKNAPSDVDGAGVALEVFGAKAGPKLAQLIREGKLSYDEMLGAITGGKETILGAGSDTADFAEKWQMFKNQVLLKLEPIARRVFDAVGQAMDQISEWWSKNGPAVLAGFETVKAGVLTAVNTIKDVVSAFLVTWDKIGPAIMVIAGLILTIMIPHWIALGVASVISSGKQVIAWVTTQTSAIAAAVVHSAQVVAMVAGWVLMGVKALFHAGVVVAGWVMTGVAAVAAAAVAIFNIGVMVAQWAFLGIQSLLHAAKVAAAWLIAMGPIGLIIAAVIAIVVLIVKNWDTIVRVTKELWEKVSNFFSNLWQGIKDGVKAAVEWVVEKFNWLKDKIMAPINWIKDKIKGLPFVPGSPIPMVTWANEAVQGVNKAWGNMRGPGDMGLPSSFEVNGSAPGRSGGLSNSSVPSGDLVIQIGGEVIGRIAWAELLKLQRANGNLRLADG